MQTRLIKPFVRGVLVLAGLVLMVGAFAGVLLIGSNNSQPTYRVVMAYGDILAGERLSADKLKVASQQMDPALARLYVQEHELDQFGTARVIETLRRGDPLSKVKLSFKELPGAGQGAADRYASMLGSPDEVILTLQVEPDQIPSRIARNDFLNILLVAGDGLSSLPKKDLIDNFGQPTATPTPRPAGTPQPTATPQLALPLADLMLERVQILDLIYKKVQNPNATPDRPNEPPYIDGDLIAVVVKVPKSHQTILTFGAATRRLRYALVSPFMKEGDVQPQLGVSWSGYVDLFEWKQREAAARNQTLQGALYPSYTPVAPTPDAGVPLPLGTPVVKPARQ